MKRLLLLYLKMPVTKSAKKALRRDRRRAVINKLIKEKLKKVISLARKKPNIENLKKASSVLDQAAKRGLIHRRKASRLKSRLARLAKKTETEKKVKPPPKKKSK